jgi:Na+-translocating ferredoxin:NAD+ oxidoreductase RNF subunit RnfB
MPKGGPPGRARLLAKIYEVRSFACPKCNSKMSIIAVIMDPGEIHKILQHLSENSPSV